MSQPHITSQYNDVSMQIWWSLVKVDMGYKMHSQYDKKKKKTLPCEDKTKFHASPLDIKLIK